jgi:hypothetical protein
LYKQTFAGRDATIPEIYKWNLVESSKFHWYFSGSCIPTNESLFILLALPTLAQTVHNISQLLAGDSR